MAARMRFFRARVLSLSSANKSMARHLLPLRPALKSLSGSARLAPLEKVSFTLSLCALATAIIPSRDQTGLPIHFHSSMISRSASRMVLRMPASVLPRQSVSPSISWSIRSDGFIGSLCLQLLSRFHASRFIGRFLREKSSKDMAFPHPQPRKEQNRKKEIPNNGCVVLSIRRRIIDVTNHRNAKDNVNPAGNRTLGGFFHDGFFYLSEITALGPITELRGIFRGPQLGGAELHHRTSSPHYQ